jgi:hypothetical protein
MKIPIGKLLACAVLAGLTAACGTAAAGGQQSHQDHQGHQGHAAPGAGGHAGHPSPGAAQPSRAAKVMSIEEIGGVLGCPEPNMQTDAEEIRQAMCTTDRGRYVLVTFATEKGKREWLDEAQPYGGSYLIGARWVAVSELPQLQSAQKELGGAIETTGHH